MHGVNLDLLHTMPHHSDGRPRDAQAHHRAEHLAGLRAARRARWHGLLRRLLALLAVPSRKAVLPKEGQTSCP